MNQFLESFDAENNIHDEEILKEYKTKIEEINQNLVKEFNTDQWECSLGALEMILFGLLSGLTVLIRVLDIAPYILPAAMGSLIIWLKYCCRIGNRSLLPMKYHNLLDIICRFKIMIILLILGFNFKYGIM